METNLKFILVLGVLLYLFVIFYLLKKKKLSVQFSIVWLFSGFVMLVFALFPGVVYILGDIVRVINPVNFVFSVLFVFVLLILLSLSSALSVYSEKIKRLTQHVALLEERIRELENEEHTKHKDEEGTS
jgi:Uncharacterized conserved protein (DUF2304).